MVNLKSSFCNRGSFHAYAQTHVKVGTNAVFLLLLSGCQVMRDMRETNAQLCGVPRA